MRETREAKEASEKAAKRRRPRKQTKRPRRRRSKRTRKRPSIKKNGVPMPMQPAPAAAAADPLLAAASAPAPAQPGLAPADQLSHEFQLKQEAQEFQRAQNATPAPGQSVQCQDCDAHPATLKCDECAAVGPTQTALFCAECDTAFHRAKRAAHVRRPLPAPVAPPLPPLLQLRPPMLLLSWARSCRSVPTQTTLRTYLCYAMRRPHPWWPLMFAQSLRHQNRCCLPLQ